MYIETDHYEWLNGPGKITDRRLTQYRILFQGTPREEPLITLGFERTDGTPVREHTRGMPHEEDPSVEEYLQYVGKLDKPGEYRPTFRAEQKIAIPTVAIRKTKPSGHELTAAISVPASKYFLRVIHAFQPAIPENLRDLYLTMAQSSTREGAQSWGTLMTRYQLSDDVTAEQLIPFWRAMKLWEGTPLSPMAAAYFRYCYQFVTSPVLLEQAQREAARQEYLWGETQDQKMSPAAYIRVLDATHDRPAQQAILMNQPTHMRAVQYALDIAKDYTF